MDRIRELINKRKLDAKFKRAGEGYRLDSTVKDGNMASSGQDGDKSSEVAQKLAAEAAMKRMANSSSFKPPISRTQRSIMEEARRQLQSCKLQEEQKQALSKEKEVEESQPPKPGNLASIAGVYFTCELVGSDVCMEKNDLLNLIEERLRGCLAEEPLLSSTLMIATLNPTIRRAAGMEVLCKYLDNLLNNITEPKYRSIRIGNKIFTDKVSCLKGGLEFLNAAGFEKTVVDNVEYLKMADDRVDPDHLQLARDVLVSTEPISIKLHRNPRVFKMDSATSLLPRDDQLSADFFRLRDDELRQEQWKKAEEVQRLTTLRTRAMREKDDARGRSRFRYSLIRVRFPDDWVLQGVFNGHEKLQAVHDFVQQYVSCNWIPFHLQVPSEPKFSSASYDISLSDLRLSPAALLRFEWDETVVRDAVAAGQTVPSTYLKPELCTGFSNQSAD